MAALQVAAVIIYLILGFFQLAATYAGLEIWVGLHWVVAGPVAFFLAYFPLIGTNVGVFGAVEAWGWSWPQAVGLFFGPLVVIVILSVLSGMIDAITTKSR